MIPPLYNYISKSRTHARGGMLMHLKRICRNGIKTLTLYSNSEPHSAMGMFNVKQTVPLWNKDYSTTKTV